MNKKTDKYYITSKENIKKVFLALCAVGGIDSFCCTVTPGVTKHNYFHLSFNTWQF